MGATLKKEFEIINREGLRVFEMYTISSQAIIYVKWSGLSYHQRKHDSEQACI